MIAGLFSCLNDYKDMRIISDELFARLVKELAKDERVAIFQQLLLSPKKDETAPAEEENTEPQQGGDK